ncbi:Imm59 family immunity protein [Cohnella sp. GCM10027633]|uniref:Imm59 family immunity protein n=1 Tax=unclassified Cohnella TaxID=2636738 RepID=UPI0036305709
MTRNEAIEIVKGEQLKHYNWYEEHDINSNEVGIKEQVNKWFVYSSDEKANLITENEFHSESEALENFIKRLRAMNKLIDWTNDVSS